METSPDASSSYRDTRIVFSIKDSGRLSTTLFCDLNTMISEKYEGFMRIVIIVICVISSRKKEVSHAEYGLLYSIYNKLMIWQSIGHRKYENH
jgi:hypothetical protein